MPRRMPPIMPPARGQHFPALLIAGRVPDRGTPATAPPGSLTESCPVPACVTGRWPRPDVGATAIPPSGERRAGACGGLVGENGTIQLVADDHARRVPRRRRALRDVVRVHRRGRGGRLDHPAARRPDDVERGGDWTLQRLAQEVAPPPDECRVAADRDGRRSGGAEVLLETKIDALDITVLRGGGDEVGDVGARPRVLPHADAPEVLDFYADRSPIFMAARFDVSPRRELARAAGDGTPIMLTIPTDGRGSWRGRTGGPRGGGTS